MLKIQRILLDNGFKRIQGSGLFSSIIEGGVASLYEKDDIKITVGLHEYGLPPTLIHPTPYVEQSKVIEWIQKSSDKEIVNFILKKST